MELLQSPGLPEEFAVDAALITSASEAFLSEEDIEVPEKLEESILTATCGVSKSPFSRFKIAVWSAAVCVAIIGVVILFSVGNDEPIRKQIAENVVSDTIVEKKAEMKNPVVSESSEAIETLVTMTPKKPRLAVASDNVEKIQQGHIYELTDSIEAERMLAEALTLISSTLGATNRSLAELAEATEYLQIANILLK